MATAEIAVRITDLKEFKELVNRIAGLIERQHTALGDARAWLADETPQWVRDEVGSAFDELLPMIESLRSAGA